MSKQSDERELRDRNIRNARVTVSQAVDMLHKLAFNMQGRHQDNNLLEWRLAIVAVAHELSGGVQRYLPDPDARTK